MESEADKLRDDLMRYRSLRTRTIDKRTRKAIDELNKETEERESTSVIRRGIKALIFGVIGIRARNFMLSERWVQLSVPAVLAAAG
jgi:hypothetical protein